MSWKEFIILIIFVLFNSSTPSRRITDGKRVNAEKRYMVYLLKSEKSNMQLYDSWLCGGAIVSPTYILTSAACLRDVTFLYAIAGYNKYVRSENLDQDNCTRERKQKVVKTCIPKRYKFSYANVQDWASIDIGLAIVEKPYDFTDITYRRYCSYPPAPIKINYDIKYQENGTNAIVYGWGHPLALRSDRDNDDYNQEYLQETTTKIVNNTYCLQFFPNITNIITNFMVCCTGKGDIDQDGNLDGPVPVLADGCSNRRRDGNGRCPDSYYDDDPNDDDDFVSDLNKDFYSEFNDDFETRRNGNNTKLIKVSKTVQNEIRRQGVICQNDHGGPLVTWRGSEEIVIGVASTSLISPKLHCVAPHLYTSTQCTSLFLKCALDYAPELVTRKRCQNMGKELGYEIQETEIDWNNENETQGDFSGTLDTTYDEEVLRTNTSNADNNPNIIKDTRKEDERTNKEDLGKEVDSHLDFSKKSVLEPVVDDVVII